MLIGYAKDSSDDQPLELQLKALSDAGCAKIFSDQKSVTRTIACDALQAALDFVREGDTFVVTQLDHLASSLEEVQGVVSHLAGRGVHFRWQFHTPSI